MFIWGWNNKAIGQTTTDLKCTHCGHVGLVLVATQTFFNIFWVPTIPLKKHLRLVCPNCNTVFDPEAFHMDTYQAKKSIKTPWWAYSGLVLITAFVALGIVLVKYEAQQTTVYLQDLHAGDLVILSSKKDGKTWYSYLKIKSVTADKVSIQESKHAFSRERDAKTEALKDNTGSELSEEVHEMPKEQLKHLDIVSVQRP